LAPR
jgi:outer membrane protein, multidrug efflux system